MIRLDQEIINKLLKFMGITKETFEGIYMKEDSFKILSINERVDSFSKMIYTHFFHINPSKFNFSFIGGEDKESQELLRAMLKLPKEFMSAVDSAPISLGGMALEHSFHSQHDLLGKIYGHYKSEVMRQTLSILGSYEVLGNPTSLFSNIGEGFVDLFHDPSEGGTESPKKFSKKLSNGESFARKTFYGVFNSASSVTSGVGSGISYVSMDSEYRKRRLEMKRRKKATNVLQGLEYGVKELGSGFVEGISGVVEQPMKGLEQEGVQGMFGGIAKGLLGFVIKPAVGVIDMVQRTTEGIKNVANVNIEPERMRLPRYIPSDSSLPMYDEDKAKIQYLLHTLDDFKFSNSELWDDFDIMLQKQAPIQVKLLITNIHLVLTNNEESSIASIRWEFIKAIRWKNDSHETITIILAHEKVEISSLESSHTEILFERLHECWSYFKAIDRIKKRDYQS